MSGGHYCASCGLVQSLGSGFINCRGCGHVGLRGFSEPPKRVYCPDHIEWSGWDDGVNDDIGRHMRTEHASPLVGWCTPSQSRKEHAFVNGRSLCGKWAVLVKSERMTHTPTEAPCASCERKATAA